MIRSSLQFVLIFYGISCTAWSIMSDSFLDPTSLMSMTQEISQMFKYFNYPKSHSEKTNIIKNMLEKMALYDVPLTDFDNWEKIFLTSTEDLQISRRNSADIFKYNLNNIMLKINETYARYEMYASKLSVRDKEENIKYISPASHNFNRIMSLVNLTDDDDLYLQKISVNIRWFQYNKCNYDMQPMQYFVFESCLSFISMQLKAFLIDVFFYSYQYASDKAIENTHRNEIIEKTRRMVNDNLNKYYTIMKHALIVSSKKIEMCDKKSLKKGENYLELTRISSESSDSDTARNMVVTGVKFVKINNTIHTQIKQGVLIPGGRTKNNEWKSIKNFDSKPINVNLKETFNFNLNDLRCPSDDYIVTGVGLRKSELKENADRIVPSIKCHRIDFTIGELVPQTSTGPREDMQQHVNQLEIGNLQPSYTNDTNYPDSEEDEFVRIKMSADNQSVIPWLDAQGVASKSNVPLYGVGLYHRGSSNSGGFLAYRLISIDYTRFIFSDYQQKVMAHVKHQKEIEKSPPRHYCGSHLADTLCVLCNNSYYQPDHHQKRRFRTEFVGARHRRSIIDECCTEACSAEVLKQYCGPPRVNITNLNC